MMPRSHNGPQRKAYTLCDSTLLWLMNTGRMGSSSSPMQPRSAGRCLQGSPCRQSYLRPRRYPGYILNRPLSPNPKNTSLRDNWSNQVATQREIFLERIMKCRGLSLKQNICRHRNKSKLSPPFVNRNPVGKSNIARRHFQHMFLHRN